MATAALVVAGFSAAAIAGERLDDPGYELLSMAGKNVKWGDARLGTPAIVRYAFLRTPTRRNAVANCAEMRPFPSRFEAGGAAAVDVAREFRVAFDAWQQIAAVRFEEVADAAAADLVLGVQANPRGVAYADVVPVAAPHRALGSIRSAAICLNPLVHWNSVFDADLATHDLRYVAMHEIGHVLGLDHAWGKTDRVMDFRYLEKIRTLQPEDIAGAVHLYGPPSRLTADSRRIGSGSTDDR